MTQMAMFILLVIVLAYLSRHFHWVNSGGVSITGVFLGIAVVLWLWLCQRLLARRRLLLPVTNIVSRTALQLPESDYRPPLLRIGAQPSQVASLLWQQLRQAGPVCICLIGISTLWTLVFAVTSLSPRPLTFVSVVGQTFPAFAILSASWLGAIVFYGDNVNRRCAFFADRGIEPTRIWWTRMVPPALSCIILLLLIAGTAASVGLDDWPQFLAVAIVLFAFGQLVSQWVERPLLAFFAAPAYAGVSLAPIAYVMDYFDGDFALILMTVPVLLFASWRLTGRWLENRVKAGYTIRVLAYTGIAVLIPCLWIIGQSFFSKPFTVVTSVEAVETVVVTTVESESSVPIETRATYHVRIRGEMP
jgi:hypothetical protein